MAAQNLLTQNSAIQSGIGEKRLGDGSQQCDFLARYTPMVRIDAMFGDVQLLADIGSQRPSTFRHRPHGKQHPPHIGVGNDGCARHRWGGSKRTPLEAIPSVGCGVLIRGFRTADSLDADRKPFIIHHGKHGAKALV
ncbi:hypothetical protein D3C71_1773100 [compost metagenome]